MEDCDRREEKKARKEDLERASRSPAFLDLDDNCMLLVLIQLSAKDIFRLRGVCRSLSGLSRATGNQESLVERAAKISLLQKYHERPQEAERWRAYTWLQRMRIEETESAFDYVRCTGSGFQFFHGPDNRIEKLKLEGIGPRMLVSEDTTATADFLHWRLEVRGNNAVELGVVPEAMQDSPKALHKCLPGPNNERPTGLFSSITVGSLLPLRVPLMKGSHIEVLAHRHKLEFLITQPAHGFEMTWMNSTTVPRPYTGPKQLRLEIELDLQGPAKLALTCWAHAEFALPSADPSGGSAVAPGQEPQGTPGEAPGLPQPPHPAPGLEIPLLPHPAPGVNAPLPVQQGQQQQQNLAAEVEQQEQQNQAAEVEQQEQQNQAAQGAQQEQQEQQNQAAEGPDDAQLEILFQM